MFQCISIILLELFEHSLNDGYLECVQFFAGIDIVAVNILVLAMQCSRSGIESCCCCGQSYLSLLNLTFAFHITGAIIPSV